VAEKIALVAGEGRSLAQRSAEAAREIGEISAAASEQNSGIGQINVAVTQLDPMTLHNAAPFEPSTAVAESLRDKVPRLADVVTVLRLDWRLVPA
jgi:methyl-accepting chemotaxis protein